MIRRTDAAAWLLAAISCASLSGCTDSAVLPEEQPPVFNGPGFSLEFRNSNSYTVVPGEVLAIDLLVHREEGFEGLVELSASDTPGVVVIFRPAAILHREDSDLLVVADQSTQRRTHQIEFRGMSQGQPTKTVILTLNVVDAK
jgi:hypothetical protein